MAKEAFIRTNLYRLVETFLRRRGIEMDEVRSINLAAGPMGPTTITVELIYGEHEPPEPSAPEPSSEDIATFRDWAENELGVYMLHGDAQRVVRYVTDSILKVTRD